MRGGEFTDGVPGEVVGTYAPRLQEPEQRHLGREDRDLRVVGAGQPLRVAVDEVGERVLGVLVGQGAHGVECLGVHGEGAVQGAAHAGALRALPGEEERGPAAGRPERLGRGERGQELVAVAADGDGAVLELGPGGHERQRDVGGRGVRARVEPVAQGVGLRGEGLGAARGDDPREDGAVGPHRGGGDGCVRVLLRVGVRLALGGCLFEDDVGVGPADAEGGDRGAAGPVGGGPGAAVGRQLHRSRGPVDLGGGLVDVQGGRQFAVPHGHHHLDDARDPGGGLRVPEVGLDGAEQQGPVRGAFAPVRGEECLRLDGVAERGAGAVRLDRVDVGCGEPGAGQRGADDALLRGAVGGGEAAARAVGVDGGAADHGEHGVAVATGVGEPLHQEHARALAPAGAVGGGREGLAAAVGREPALPAEVDERLRRRHHGHAAGQGEFALPRLQRAHRPVQRHQRGGAGGVDGDDRALQAEGVRDAAGGDARGAAVGEIAVEVVGDGRETGGVVVVHDAREHAGAAAAQGRGDDARAFERLEGRLQEQPLLRVHREGLARADAEEVGVELGGVVQESAGSGVGLAGPVGVRVVQGLHVPAAVSGEVRHGVGARGQQLPEVVGGADATGVTAPDADDRDRAVCALLVLAQPPPRLTQVRRRPPEVVEQLILVVHQRAIRSKSKKASRMRADPSESPARLPFRSRRLRSPGRRRTPLAPPAPPSCPFGHPVLPIRTECLSLAARIRHSALRRIG